ncbi:MAG TPA: ParB/RepB/Spo0J family partition protein [Desulfomonilaceae bacterium]|nr:ParB/RepB/Spo0J family partition protein [Desulfomonilaceae bacterium]
MNWLEHTVTYTLKPQAINLDDRTYFIPCYSGLESLMRSIEQVGILNPPIVQERASGELTPVLGRRRLQAASQIGLAKVEVREVPVDMPENHGFTMAFWDNVSHRELNSACVGVIVKRLLELFPRSVVARDFLPTLGVPPLGPRLERLSALGSLEDKFLEALAIGRIREKTALILSELQPEERATLLELTEGLGFNANKKAEVIGELFDLSIFHARPVLEFVRSAEAQAVLTDLQIPLPEQANRFRELLRSWKYPELSGREGKSRTRK